MKRALYNLTDEPFLMFTNHIGEVLEQEKVKHNLVGGVAVQAYLLDMLCKKYGTDIVGLSSKTDIRVQDYVRSTDDIDIAMLLEEKEDIKRIKKINDITVKFPFEAINPDGQRIVEIKSERYGASRPTFRLYVDGKGSEEEVIALNIGRGQPGSLKHFFDAFYNVFIEGSQKLTVPYQDSYALKINVPSLEHLLATKIAGARAKDLMDYKNLTDLAKQTGTPINLGVLSGIMIPFHEDKFARYLHTAYPELNRENVE